MRIFAPKQKIMAQVIVTIDNNGAIDSIIDAIKMLRGVTSAMLWKVDEPVQCATTSKRYSQRIESLRNLCGTGITSDDLAADDRLAYLLSK